MNSYSSIRAVLPLLPRKVQRQVLNWIARNRIPTGVVAVCSHDALYQALKSDLATNDTAK